MSATSFSQVTVDTKANVYFDGKVVSHTVHFADGSKKTLGLIYPGEYHFGTAAAERMEIIAGSCEVTLDGQQETVHYHPVRTSMSPPTADSPLPSVKASASISALS